MVTCFGVGEARRSAASELDEEITTDAEGSVFIYLRPDHSMRMEKGPEFHGTIFHDTKLAAILKPRCEDFSDESVDRR